MRKKDKSVDFSEARVLASCESIPEGNGKQRRDAMWDARVEQTRNDEIKKWGWQWDDDDRNDARTKAQRTFQTTATNHNVNETSNETSSFFFLISETFENSYRLIFPFNNSTNFFFGENKWWKKRNRAIGIVELFGDYELHDSAKFF